jgi:hypothetical protein
MSNRRIRGESMKEMLDYLSCRTFFDKNYQTKNGYTVTISKTFKSSSLHDYHKTLSSFRKYKFWEIPSFFYRLRSSSN